MNLVARAIHLIGVLVLAAAVLAQPAAAVPRVTCVPVAVCGPADGASTRHVPAGRHACCPAEPSSAALTPDGSTTASMGTGGCCVLTAGVPADLWAASAPAVAPAPTLDALAEPPADPGFALSRRTLLSRSVDDRAWLPPWQMRPEQGAGPRPPPFI